MQPQLSEFWNPLLERCGFVLKNGQVVEVPNIHEDPQRGFRISPDEVMRYEPEIAATWHTHPQDSANLSMADYKCFRDWPELVHFVVWKEDVRLYYVEHNRVYLHDDSDLPRLPTGAVP